MWGLRPDFPLQSRTVVSRRNANPGFGSLVGSGDAETSLTPGNLDLTALELNLHVCPDTPALILVHVPSLAPKQLTRSNMDSLGHHRSQYWSLTRSQNQRNMSLRSVTTRFFRHRPLSQQLFSICSTRDNTKSFIPDQPNHMRCQPRA